MKNLHHQEYSKEILNTAILLCNAIHAIMAGKAVMVTAMKIYQNRKP
jgi:hypothetical protein